MLVVGGVHFWKQFYMYLIIEYFASSSKCQDLHAAIKQELLLLQSQKNIETIHNETFKLVQ